VRTTGGHPTASAELVIRSAKDLRALRAQPRIAAMRPLRLDLPWLPRDVARSAEPKLAGYSNACGCAAGAAAMLAVCASLVTWLIFSYGLSAGFLWRLPIAFVGGLIAAGIGKWLGLAHARSRLSREIENLISFQPRPTEV
jgi:hypothetical protein